jgi:hypothetical protein
MPRQPKTQGARPYAKPRALSCPVCNQLVRGAQNLASHTAKCRREQSSRMSARRLADAGSGAPSSLHPSSSLQNGNFDTSAAGEHYLFKHILDRGFLITRSVASLDAGPDRDTSKGLDMNPAHATEQRRHIIIEYPPHLNREPERMFIDSQELNDPVKIVSPLCISGVNAHKPWYPTLKTRADFEFLEIWAKAKGGSEVEKRLLAGISGLLPRELTASLNISSLKLPMDYEGPYQWFDTTKITLRTKKDVENGLERLRAHGLKVCP